MPETTQASIGYGSVFEMAEEATPTVFVALGEVISIDPGEDDDEEVEATHMQSPNRTREYIPGLTTPGECVIEGNYIPGSPTDIALIAARGKRNVGRITLPNGVRKTFPIVRRGYNQAIPIDDRMTFTATFKRAGATTTDVAIAPVNGVAPAISGEVKVNQTLTAWPGVWAPFGTFTYQWTADGADIPGATASTYVPVAGDAGKALTVKVTCTNTGGAATAESEDTIDVEAAD
ncbi:histidine kinase [Arsenicitalea aurantiaca]|uniref:Histidine kinase n=1 Tax=Arsenicitalea aurantiaca TaxID=1783274 RepID=A0A433XEX8_9HYPH|nr:phage tail tube protein [Arsenicitalea aurantiaca]RUT32643.1 histidine kinase [Arsenicitalea aurantiaca]